MRVIPKDKNYSPAASNRHKILLESGDDKEEDEFIGADQEQKNREYL